MGINVATPMAGRKVCFQRRTKGLIVVGRLARKPAQVCPSAGLGGDNAWRSHGAPTDLARDADEIDVLMS
jgi:hypothetical protein